MKKICLLFITISYFTFLAFSQIPNYLLYDKEQSSTFGAENSQTVHKFIYEKTDEFLPATFFEENTFSKKLTGVSYRLLKLGLVDFQLDWLIALNQHESFGHGSRAREFGFRSSHVSLNLFWPLGSSSGSHIASRLNPDEVLTDVERLTITFGGNEGNILLSESLSARMLLQKKTHYRQALLYLLSKNNLGRYIWTDKFKADRGNLSGDMNSYVNNLNLSFFPGNPYSINRLAWQSLFSLLNPFQLYSAYSLAIDYSLKGKSESAPIPAISISDYSYLPSFGYNLTPFGSEVIMNNYIFSEKQLMQININVGDNLLYHYSGGGIKFFNILPDSKVYLNTDLQLWSQPELQLKDASKMVNEPEFGALFKLDVSYFPVSQLEQLGLFTQVGYKTKGYVLGEMLDEGLVLQFGLSFKPD